MPFLGKRLVIATTETNAASYSFKNTSSVSIFKIVSLSLQKVFISFTPTL